MMFVRGRFLTLLAAAAVAAALVTGVGAGSAQAAPGTWLGRINAYRAMNGRGRLVESYQASQVAQVWSVQMATTGRLAHNPGYRFQILAPWSVIGENVGYGTSEAQLFNAFVSSPSHRANLLRPDFSRVGIGQVVVNGRMWTTEVFFGGPLVR